jgi:hypothetical protein
MLLLTRRLLVLAALLFWQGGFTFYSAVVVHVGQDVLGSHRSQGFVTRRVTNYLNLGGAIALPLLAWDSAGARDRRALRRWARWTLWAGMALTLAALVWLHFRLDTLLDPASFGVLDPESFSTLHAWYLHTSTVQWLCALLFGGLTIAAWRREDRVAAETS